MIPHTMKKNANCTSSVITTNCFQFGGVAKAVLLLGFLCQRELSLTHAKFLLAILLDGIAEVFFSIGSINEDFVEGYHYGIMRGVHISRLANRDGSQ
jgi:hypothetical protein